MHYFKRNERKNCDTTYRKSSEYKSFKSSVIRATYRQIYQGAKVDIY